MTTTDLEQLYTDLDLDPRRGLMRAHAIAAFVAANTPLTPARYRLVSVPGAELTPRCPVCVDDDCPWCARGIAYDGDICGHCGGPHHIQRCVAIRAELMREGVIWHTT